MHLAFKFIGLALLSGPLIFVSCTKEFSCENGCGANRPPIAKAGTDALVLMPVDSFLLDGSASSDPDNNITSFEWTKVSGPASFEIVAASASKTLVRNPELGVYHFELKVTDGGGLFSMDTVEIIVDSATSPLNHPPVAFAGADQSVIWPFSSADLDGSQSSDPDNNITTFEWTKISGPASFTVSNLNSAQTQITNLVEGSYQFVLKVTDAGGLSSMDTVQIDVLPPGSSNCDMSARPVVNAQLMPFGTLSEGRFGMVAGSVGNKILFAGGITPGPISTRVDIYDLVNGSWSTAALSEGREGMTAATVGNKIFFAGGGSRNAGIVTSRVDIYDASTNDWSTAELSEARCYLASATLGNKIFFAGGGSWGSNYFKQSARVDIYDNSTNTWETAQLSEARSGLAANTVGNKIYFAGGESPVDSWKASRKIDIYDGATNTWSTSSLREGKMFMGNIAVGNKIYWAAGFNTPQSAGYTESDQVEIKNVNTQNSTYACILPKSQFSAVVKDSRIVFFTGAQGYPNQFDIYDTGNEVWSVGTLNKRVNGAAIISVRNTIYVAGGTVNGTGYSNQVYKLEF